MIANAPEGPGAFLQGIRTGSDGKLAKAFGASSG